MRTTLNIDDDILAAIKDLAQKERVSAGRILSRLARESLTSRNFQQGSSVQKSVTGFRPFPPRKKFVSSAQVDRLRDDEGICMRALLT